MFTHTYYPKKLYVKFYYNAEPMVPPGIRLVTHTKPSNRYYCYPNG